MTSATDRPAGVMIMAVVAAIVGVTDIFAGLGDLGIAGGFLGDHGFGKTIDTIMTVVGVVLVGVGVLGLATAFGLIRERNRAWLIAMLWASVCIVAQLHGHRHRRRRGALVPLPAACEGGVRAHLTRIGLLANGRWACV